MLSTTNPRTFGLILAALLVMACEGPMGPEGPRGPEGPEGPAGEHAMLHMAMAQVGSDGSASVRFDGLQVEDAVVTCYLSDSRDGPWLVIGTDLEGVTCGAGNSGSDLVVVIQDAPVGWWFMATAATGGDQ